MATLTTGNTIPGYIRFRKEDEFGDMHTLLSGIESDRLDKSGSTGDLIVNRMVYQTLTENQRAERVPETLTEGETLVIELKGTLASEVADYDKAGDVEIGIRKMSSNRKKKVHDQITSSDQEIGANVTVTNGAYISVFEVTVPTGQTWILQGIQKFAAIST